MAPAKRGRPAFSPPKPRKATSTSKPKSNAGGESLKKSGSSAPKRTPGSVTKPQKAITKSNAITSRKRSRLVSPTPSASDSIGGSTDENELISVEADEEEDEENEKTRLTNQHNDGSPEPDFILAEISHETNPSEPAIPLGLVHRILHSQFAEPEKTKISTDAREVVGRYIETFVREAIARCAFEKTGEDQNNNHPQQSDGGGWLEVDDLEEVAVQLCLDF